jgi:hypothetical protein
VPKQREAVHKEAKLAKNRLVAPGTHKQPVCGGYRAGMYCNQRPFPAEFASKKSAFLGETPTVLKFFGMDGSGKGWPSLFLYTNRLYIRIREFIFGSAPCLTHISFRPICA